MQYRDTIGNKCRIARFFGEARSPRLRGYGSVEHEKCGWDLTCTAADRTVARVEGKGTAGPKPTVLLTRNEHRSAAQDSGWVLAVVTRAATQPTVSLYEAADVLKLAQPYVYQLDLNDTDR